VFGLPAPPARAAGAARFAPPIADPKLSLGEAVAQAQAAAPGAALAEVSTPTAGKAPAWRIQLKAPGAGRPTTIQVVDATGEVKAGPERGRGGEGPRDTVSPLMRQIHDGAGTGPVWQAIIFLTGIAPAVLGITGVVMWLRRRARKRALA
jgi:uncharacterized iron-regulated membrane protein